MSAALTTTERRELETLEGVVQRGLDTFVEVGRALAEIRDRRLYRQTHRTFEEYCHDRWVLSRTRAYRLIYAAAVVSPIGDTDPPANEAQARELTPVLRDEGEHAVVEVWRELREEFGDDVTAERVKRTVTNRIKRMRREKVAEVAVPVTPLPATVDIRHCDIRELDIEPGVVDLIFTDPPYTADTLAEYDALADFAARALRPGAMLAAYCGNVHALDCANRLAPQLEFIAFGGVHTPGAYNQVFKYKMKVRLKPLLFFSKRRFEPCGWWEQLLTSPKPTKDLHPWQQSEGDSGALIQSLRHHSRRGASSGTAVRRLRCGPERRGRGSATSRRVRPGGGRVKEPEEPVDTSPRVCQCDGQLVERDEDGVWCLRCGRRKAAK
jgi:16S rRNA G966 N2-methylase RsmD